MHKKTDTFAHGRAHICTYGVGRKRLNIDIRGGVGKHKKGPTEVEPFVELV